MDSTPVHSVDDPLDVRSWKDTDALMPQFVNETLSNKADVQNLMLLADVHYVSKMKQRVAKRNVAVSGEQVKAGGLDDDDEDVK